MSNFIKENKRYFIAFFFIGLLILTLFMLSLSKYTSDIGSDHLQPAEEFYFYSKALSKEGQICSLYNWDRTVPYTFTIDLMNSKDSLNISSADFNATLTCDNQSVTLSSSTVTFSASVPTTSTITVTVPANTTLTNNSFTITATTNTSYSETLTGTFRLMEKDPEPGSYEIDNDETSVTIYTALVAGSHTITWPSGLTPDNTMIILENAVNSSGSYTFSVVSDGYYKLRFFRTGTVAQGATITVTNTPSTIVISIP